MTIAELYQTQKLFKGNEKLTFIGEFRPYKENKCFQWFNNEWREALDNYFLCNFYDYKLLPIDIDFIKNIVQSVFEVNANKYNKMYGNLYYYDFNPLWNVDGTEKTTTVYGEVNSENVLGESNGTNTTGARSGDSTGKVNGYNDLTDELKTENQNLWTSAQATDSYHQEEVSNSNKTEEHTDTMTHERFGNIGLTMSTQLLEASNNYYAISLIETIANDVKNKITMGVW